MLTSAGERERASWETLLLGKETCKIPTCHSLRIYDNSNLREMTLSNKTRVFNNLHTLSSWSGRCINAVGAVDQTLLLLPVKLN